MPLCELCTAIDFTAPPQRRNNLFYRWRESYPRNHDIFYYSVAKDHLIAAEVKFLEHYESKEALGVSAKTCNLCRLIENCVESTLANLRKAREMEFMYEVSGYQFQLWLKEGVEGFEILGFHPNEKDYLVMGGVRLHLKNESPLRSLFNGREISPSPTSVECQTKIRGWIKECNDTHNHSRKFKAVLPTRILDIQQEGRRVALWETKNVAGEYAALSHCWGGFMPFTLNKDTLNDLKAGLNTENLPRSFQDAIWIAFQLGIQYLWIDSLCILQDDANDWANESERMTEIYRDSFLTISASRAASSANGFLANHQQPTYVPIPIQTRTSSNLSGEASAFTILPRHVIDEHLYMHLTDEPLSERGWALQERYISHRNLHFTGSQVYFECYEGFFSEDGRRSGRIRYKLEEHEMRPVNYWKAWFEIVMEYSQRKLTMEDDKLPALAGLAKHFARNNYFPKAVSIPDGHYFAGLWRDDMVRGLSWLVDCEDSQLHQHPQKYRAPTWSWACIDAPVLFQYFSTELAVVEDAHTDLHTPINPYGKVTGGWICLRGLKFRSVDYNGTGPVELVENGVSFYIFVTWDRDTYHVPKRDEEANPAQEEMELFAVPLIWDSKPNGNATTLFGPFFMIVKAVKRQVTAHYTLPHFERVGAGIAQWHEDRAGLERLVRENWAVAKESENLERFIIL